MAPTPLRRRDGSRREARRARCRCASSTASAPGRSSAVSTRQLQPPSSVSMPSRMAGSLSMQRITVPARRPAATFGAARRGRGGQSGRRAGHFDGEARAAAHIRFQGDLHCQHASDTFDDRQSEADAARDAGALVEPMEFLEHGAPLRLRDTDAGVADIDAQTRAAAPATDQHAARRRIFDRVRNQILQQAPQQAPGRSAP